jgi:lipopolysaccharide export LptBFGC system permease protein LptF
VLLELARGEGDVFTITADTAVLDIRYDEELQDDVLLIDCEGAQFLGPNSQIDIESPYWVFPMSELFQVSYREMEAKYTSSTDLRAQLDGDGLAPEARRVYEFEINRRSALSLTFVVFLLLGIPTGIVLRSGTQLGAFTGAVGYAFAYYVLIVQMQTLSTSGVLSPAVAAWATNGLFLAAGLAFFYRALWR